MMFLEKKIEKLSLTINILWFGLNCDYSLQFEKLHFTYLTSFKVKSNHLHDCYQGCQKRIFDMARKIQNKLGS